MNIPENHIIILSPDIISCIKGDDDCAIFFSFKGKGEILDKIKDRLGIDVGECTPDGKFSIDATRCIGACGLAPVMTIGEDVYGRLTVDDLDEILAKYN